MEKFARQFDELVIFVQQLGQNYQPRELYKRRLLTRKLLIFIRMSEKNHDVDKR